MCSYMNKFKVRKVFDVAGVCMFGSLFCFVRFIICLIKYLVQLRRGRGVAEICSLSDTYNEIADSGKVSFTEYKYVVKIVDGDTAVLKKMIEKVSGEGASKYSIKDRVAVFYDNDDDVVLAVKAVKNDVIIWLAGVGICIVGLIVSMLIAIALA